MRIARIGMVCLFGLAVLIALTVAACGNDDDAAVPPPTAAPAATPETSADDSEETAMDDGHDHDHDHSTGDDHDHATSVDAVPDATIEVEVAGGKPVDGVQRFQIDARDTVTIIVNGDTTDELHIHGYDLVVGFAPGQPGSITFEADIPGIFEAETHHRGDLVMELEVR